MRAARGHCCVSHDTADISDKVSVGVRVVDSMTPDRIREEMDDIVRFLRKVAASADA